MSLSHADYRPARRQRRVPTGTPRRKIPLIRVALLIALGVFIAARFDDYWPKLREWFTPSAVQERIFGTPSAENENEGDAGIDMTWSDDSLRFTAACPQGFTANCCAALAGSDATLCGGVRAGLAKARWHGKLGDVSGALRIEARFTGSAHAPGTLHGWSVTSIRGRDGRGPFEFRRPLPGREWCDAGRGCLGPSSPRAPLQNGRLVTANDGGSLAEWTSNSRNVVSVLPGRIVSVDSLEAGGTRIRVWHGMELYTSYEPVTPAEAARPGAHVGAGSQLGNLHATSRNLLFKARQAGVPVDPALFWEQGAKRPSGLSAMRASSLPRGDG